jgi:hypothetical protein
MLSSGLLLSRLSKKFCLTTDRTDFKFQNFAISKLQLKPIIRRKKKIIKPIFLHKTNDL